MDSKRSPVFYWLIAAFALAPALIYAWLGQFSRMLADDYCIIGLGRKLSAWNYMVHKLDTWSGSYANWFLKGAMAPLDTLAPRIIPALIIVLWLAGLFWLGFQLLAYLKLDKPRLALSVSISAVIVTASINAFHSMQSFYWYSSSTQTALSLALLTIYMALALWTAQQWRGGGIPHLLGIIAGGLLCFISAGMYEMFVVFQTIFLTFCLLISFAFLRGSVRRSYALVYGVGWLATLVGLAIQLSSPGIALRAARIERDIGPPNREMLLTRTLGWTFDYLGHPQIFVGFAMLLAVGLLVVLVKYKPQPVSKAAQPVKLALPPLWLGLMFQLLWMPLLWLHTSDHPQFFGRFSGRYMVIVILNMVFILSFLILLWQRKRIQAALQECERGLLTVGYILALMFIFAILFAITQLSISSRLSIYLSASVLAVLVILTWQLSSLLSSAAARRFGLLALCSSGIGLVSMAAIVFLALFGRSHVDLRILAPNDCLLALSGLVWGGYAGWLLKHYGLSSQAGRVWMRLLERGSLAAVVMIAVGIVLGQVALMPNFQLYAREWDLRHQEIIAMSDSGQTVIEVASLTYDLADYLALTPMAYSPMECSEQYFGVDSMRAADA